MKKLRVLIIICIILVFILIGIIIINKISEERMNQELISDEQKMGVGEFSEDIIEEVAYSEWLQVQQCINQYLDIVNKENSAYYGRDENNNYVKVIEESEIKNNIYGLLSKSYIEKNTISVDNVYNYIDDITNNQTYTILQLKKIVNTKSNQFIAEGIIEENNELISVKNFIVNFNLEEATFSIEPIEENVDINNIQVKDVEVETNNYNAIPKVLASNENIIKEYFNIIKKLILIYPEKAYEFLDEEYKTKKFDNFEEFQVYLEKNKEKFSQMQIDGYQKSVTDNFTQYVCIDNIGNYYIFREYDVMDYRVILDTYTIDLPEFLEKYNAGTEQVKVALNIDKFMQAINDKDYKYAYNCLADSYKNNYFKTQADFENYAKENFYSSSSVAYKQFDIQNNVYTYSVVLTNEETGEQMNKTFIMQLGEGTEFVLSFNK